MSGFFNWKVPKKSKQLKATLSIGRIKRLVVPRPDVLHGYLPHMEINQYLEYLERRYSNFVRVLSLGHTYERRTIKGIEINWCCHRNEIAQAKEAKRLQSEVYDDQHSTLLKSRRNMIFIEGGTHGREWITISVALNCIYQLTERNLRNREILRKLRFFIVPVTNPDGYEHTRVKNRRWRKNRRPNGNAKCIGTDCNRNYDFHWDMGPSRPTRNTYKGEKPFSEPETRALRNILTKYQKELLFFLSLHSHAQCLMYPWGYTKELPESWSAMQTLATTGRNAIRAYNGRIYRTGSIAGLTKRTISGSVVDYAFGVIKVPLALVMELPSGGYGFQPPAESISPIGHESWFGIREMCRTAFDLLPMFPKSDLISSLEGAAGDHKNNKPNKTTKTNNNTSSSKSVKTSTVAKPKIVRPAKIEKAKIMNLPNYPLKKILTKLSTIAPTKGPANGAAKLSPVTSGEHENKPQQLADSNSTQEKAKSSKEQLAKRMLPEKEANPKERNDLNSPSVTRPKKLAAHRRNGRTESPLDEATSSTTTEAPPVRKCKPRTRSSGVHVATNTDSPYKKMVAGAAAAATAAARTMPL